MNGGNPLHRTACGCDECTLTPAERVAKASGVGGLDAHDLEVAQLREQVRLLSIAASATGDGFLPLSVREALRTGDEAPCRAWPQKALAIQAELTKSRDEAWARVAGAEESERKWKDLGSQSAAACDRLVDMARADEREGCARAVEALRLGGCFDDIEAAHDRAREMALINATDAIRKRGG